MDIDETVTHERRQAEPWVVELKIAGCTIRRRATRRRDLLGVGDRGLPAGESPRSGPA